MRLGFNLIFFLFILFCKVEAPKQNIFDPTTSLGGSAVVALGLGFGNDLQITTRYKPNDYPTIVKTEYLDLDLSAPVASFFTKEEFRISEPYQNDLILRDVFPLSESKLRVLFSVSSRSEWRDPLTITIAKPDELTDYSFRGKQLEFRFPYPKYFGSISEAKGYITSTILVDGRILLVGGVNPSGSTLATVEILNPETGLSKVLPSLNQSLMGMAICVQKNGRVYVSGGKTVSGNVTHETQISNKIYLIDPVNEAVTELPFSMQRRRHGHTMVCLNQGDLLVSGGQFQAGADASAVINDHEYISTSGSSSTILGVSSNFPIGISFHSAEYDEVNSRILYFGGRDRLDPYAFFSNTVYSIDTNSYNLISLPGVFSTARSNVTHVKMPNRDRVLFGGMIREGTGTKSIESWNENKSTTTSLGFTTRFKNGSAISKFSNEQVFYTGGIDTYYKSGILELYDHYEKKNFIVDTMMIPRSEHSAHLTSKGIVIFGDSTSLDTRVEIYGKD
ncbi:kelch repeat-containing protein [Leptospira bouyouniensis]|uniref:Kelch repeat-containing protein n=1 Tax=Leptospira bouyouniensis TaxID=2484911 RepID=A0ABY2L858_9LEPT|nr:kelch repeat-containing protein [Leptospira bouyouniensis]TGK49717.1 kelch repeat-containing protein [Leptospira bouyouniensis]